MLEQRVQFAFQPAQVDLLPRDHGTGAGGEKNDHRDGRIITELEEGKY